MPDSANIMWLDGPEGSVLDEFEARSGVTLHPVARTHLLDSEHHERPFPRLERHEGYLFGIIYVPSDTTNTKADFDRIVFAVSHDHAIATICAHHSSVHDWVSFRQTARTHLPGDGPAPLGGRFLFHVLRESVNDMLADAVFVVDQIEGLTSDHSSIDLRTSDLDGLDAQELSPSQRRRLLEHMRSKAPTISAIRHELPVILRVAAETSEMLEALAHDDDRLDLRTDSAGRPRDLFSRSLEIHLADVSSDSRYLLSLLEQTRSTIEFARDFMKQLSDDENVASNRFTGAIASIMLLPTFIVGLYGQNFVKLPETQWQYGYLFSWVVIAALTAGQIAFFRRRKWI